MAKQELGQSEIPQPLDVMRGEVERLSSELRDLRAQVALLFEIERYRDIVLERHPISHSSPPSTRRLDARDFVEQADGFYPLEYDLQGVPYRWTGPGRSTRVRFYVDRSVPVMVVMRLSSLGRNSEFDRVTLDIDGTVYPMRRLGGPDVVMVAGPVAPREGPSMTELFLYVPILFSPQEDGADDERMLGIAIMSIEIQPASP